MPGIYRKVKELRFKKVKERQVRKFNNLLNKGNITWQRPQVTPVTRASTQVANRQASQALAAGAPHQIALNSQAGRQSSPQVAPNSQAVSQASPQATVRQASQADSTLSQAENTISQAGNPQASPVNSALSQLESSGSQAGNPPASLADNTLSQPESTGLQASLADSALSQAESEVSQAGNPQAAPAVRCSARLRGSQASQKNNADRQSGSCQIGSTSLGDSTISQPDSEASQPGTSQASVSQVTSSASPQEARPSPLPNRHNSPQGSSPREEPKPKWVINLSSKPLTMAQRSVLAKGPNFAVSPKHPPNLEYITAIEAACTKLSQQDAEELRANVSWVLRASHLPKPNLTKVQSTALKELKKDRDCIVLTADRGVTMVIMDRQDYISKADTLVNQNTYRSIPQDPTNTIKNKIINILKRVKSQTGLRNQN